MTDHELVEALASGQVSGQCPCGVPKTAAPAFHRASTVHDCVRHASWLCGHCRRVQKMIAQIEARLKAEAEHGPFII